MANAVLAYDDRVDRGTVTASDQLSTLPATNLQHPFLSPRVWRTSSNSAYAQVDFGAAVAIDVVALLATNLTASATWRVRLDSDSGFSAPHTYDSGTVAPGIDTTYGHCILVLPSQTTAQYLRVDVADATLTFLQAGRLFAAAAWRMARNFEFGFKEGWRDQTKQTATEAGQVWVDRGPAARVWTLRLPAVTETERRTYLAPIGRLARARDVLFVADPASTNLGRDSLFGLPEEPLERTWDRPAYHSLPLTIVERL